MRFRQSPPIARRSHQAEKCRRGKFQISVGLLAFEMCGGGSTKPSAAEIAQQKASLQENVVAHDYKRQDGGIGTVAFHGSSLAYGVFFAVVALVFLVAAFFWLRHLFRSHRESTRRRWSDWAAWRTGWPSASTTSSPHEPPRPCPTSTHCHHHQASPSPTAPCCRASTTSAATTASGPPLLFAMTSGSAPTGTLSSGCETSAAPHAPNAFLSSANAPPSGPPETAPSNWWSRRRPGSFRAQAGVPPAAVIELMSAALSSANGRRSGDRSSSTPSARFTLVDEGAAQQHQQQPPRRHRDDETGRTQADVHDAPAGSQTPGFWSSS